MRRINKSIRDRQPNRMSKSTWGGGGGRERERGGERGGEEEGKEEGREEGKEEGKRGE